MADENSQNQQPPQNPPTEGQQWKPGGGQWTGQGSNAGPGQGEPPTSPPSQTQGFTHPAFVGKTPQEIESIALALAAENERLARAAQAVQTPTGAPQAPPGEQAPEYDYENPGPAIGWHVRKALEPLLQPVLQSTRLSAEQTARAQLRAHPVWGGEFQRLENQINLAIAESTRNGQPLDTSNPQVLANLLFFVRGQEMQAPPQTPPQAPLQPQPGYGPPPQSQPQYRYVPPPIQHAPSPPPAPPQPGQPVAPLNENELRLAREWGMSPEDYRKWQSMKSGDVFAMREDENRRAAAAAAGGAR